MLIDTSKKGVPVGSSSGLLSGSGDFFSASFVTPQLACGSSCWATWLCWSVFFLEVAHGCVLCSGASKITDTAWWTTRKFRSLCCSSVWRRFVGGSRRTGGCSVSLSRFPLHPCCCISTRLLGWGAHLLDLTASGVWSQEETPPSSVLCRSGGACMLQG